MARIKFSGLINDISGSIGGSTIQRSGHGSIIRNKPIQKKAYTESQNKSRVYMSQIQASWHSLDTAGQEYWKTYLSFSQSKCKKDKNFPLSGYQLFVKYNFYRLLCGLEIVTVPSYELGYPSSFLFQLQITSVPILLFYSATPYMTIDTFPVIKLSAPVPFSGFVKKSNLRNISYTLFDANNLNLSSSYLAIFGSLPVASQVLQYSLSWFHSRAAMFSRETFGNIIVTNQP